MKDTTKNRQKTATAPSKPLAPVLTLTTKPLANNENLIDVLEVMLDLAREGAITGLIFGINRNGDYECGSVGRFHDNPLEAIGMAARMTRQFNRHLDKWILGRKGRPSPK